MNNRLYRHIKNIILILISIFVMNIAAYSADDTIIYDKWGITKENIISNLKLTDKDYIIFQLKDKSDYNNKIVTYIVTLAKELEPEIDVLRITSRPEKDFLFIKNKLCSIKESYKNISKNNFNNLLQKLTSAYGKPTHNPGDAMDIYFIDTENTKVILHYHKQENLCIIYFHDSKLFHNLTSGKY